MAGYSSRGREIEMRFKEIDKSSLSPVAEVTENWHRIHASIDDLDNAAGTIYDNHSILYIKLSVLYS